MAGGAPASSCRLLNWGARCSPQFPHNWLRAEESPDPKALCPQIPKMCVPGTPRTLWPSWGPAQASCLCGHLCVPPGDLVIFTCLSSTWAWPAVDAPVSIPFTPVSVYEGVAALGTSVPVCACSKGLLMWPWVFAPVQV